MRNKAQSLVANEFCRFDLGWVSRIWDGRSERASQERSEIQAVHLTRHRKVDKSVSPQSMISLYPCSEKKTRHFAIAPATQSKWMFLAPSNLFPSSISVHRWASWEGSRVAEVSYINGTLLLSAGRDRPSQSDPLESLFLILWKSICLYITRFIANRIELIFSFNQCVSDKSFVVFQASVLLLLTDPWQRTSKNQD